MTHEEIINACFVLGFLLGVVAGTLVSIDRTLRRLVRDLEERAAPKRTDKV